MDKSFLSYDAVIKASRDFVCIRLATYEDADEADFLRTVYMGQSGDLENTVFAILSPDTKKNLCRPGRGPNFAFGTPRILAENMNSIAKRYTAKEDDKRVPALPQMKNIRLGINVAACDGLPAIVCYSKDEEQMKEMKESLVGASSDESLAGKFVFASTADSKEMSIVKGFEGRAGIYVTNPDQFGLEASVAKMFPPNAEAANIKSALQTFADGTAKVEKSHRDHVRDGSRANKSWETEIPVTDQMTLRAQEARDARGGPRGSRGGPPEGGRGRGGRPPRGPGG